MHWLVDGNNVFGSVPDGWWNDRGRAAGRLADRIDRWMHARRLDHEPDDRATVVFDDAPDGGPWRWVDVERAPRRGRDAADHRLVELAEEALAADPTAGRAIVVVTADKGLIERLPPGVGVERPRRFLERLDPA